MNSYYFVEAFLKAMKTEGLTPQKQRLLIAVSGGLDSSVLAELAWRTGFDFGIAHANFGLRGEDSRADEAFVKEMAAHYKKPFFRESFSPKEVGTEKGISLQVAARDLRYDWFRGLMEQQDDRFDILVTAHHLDDNIETSMMHFFRGTGIAGLRGMLPRQGNIVRPLLNFSKAELKDFALTNGLSWREDISNQGDAYTRNYFRNRLIPSLREVFPSVEHNLAANINRFRETEIIFRQAMEKQLGKLLKPAGAEIHIPVLLLKKTVPLDTYLHAILERFGFPVTQLPDMRQLLDAESGKYIAGPAHRIIRNRSWLIVAPLEQPDPGIILVETGNTEVLFPEGKLLFGLTASAPASPDPDKMLAWLDAAEINFPLILRRAKAGDYFYPLGMTKKKKIARFLVDQKLSRSAKEKVWVLEMDRKILWVTGQRIDNRFRLTPKTASVLKVELRVL